MIDELYEIDPRRVRDGGADAHHTPAPPAAPSQPQPARHREDTFRDRIGRS